jgi:hypothetical protein
MLIATVPRSKSLFWLKEKNNFIKWLSRSNFAQSNTHRQEADEDEDPPIEEAQEGDVMERESYWTDDDGSFSEEYNSEETVEDGSKMIVDSDSKSDSEEIENENCVPDLQDTEISALQETCEPELVSCPQTTPMPSPAVISNGQQESTIQQLTETNEYEPEDSNIGRRTSGRVWKRTQVDGKCECDTEITNEEKERGTQVMMCKALESYTPASCGIA